jgi:heterodisulfide reductase subunit A-like polyferredoxin
MREPEAAFVKAKDLIRMGVSKVAKLEPLDDVIIEVTPTALVLGGGVSGMSAAINLNNQGFKVYLVEKDENLGGMLNSLYKVFPTDEYASDILDDMRRKILSADKIEIYTSTIVKEILGYIGNYEIVIEKNGIDSQLQVGTIIIATGAKYLTPEGFYKYDGTKRITQLELENRLKEGSLDVKNVVMIQCVGSKIQERKYCSSICCATAIKNALILKEQNPDVNVTILYRDIYTPGIEYENYYKRARTEGIVFIKYNPEQKPTLINGNINVFNVMLGEEVAIPYDLLVLSVPLVANEDNKEVAQLLKVPLEGNKFFLEAHVKLRPIDFATDGIFLCGTAKWPAKGLPNVVHSEDNLYTCSENGLKSIQSAIRDHKLNRVIVASCSPRTHEKLFQETIQETGLNKYLFNFVNIRDQCTWVHMREPEAAFLKAKDLIRMGVSKAAKLEPLDDVIIEVTPAALVLGGGVAGMSAAINLNNQGFQVYLIEKSDDLGGMLNSLYKVFPSDEFASDILDDMRRKILSAEKIEIYTSTLVKEILGYIGNYEIVIEKNSIETKLQVGTIIIATGAKYYTPEGLYKYDGTKRITQLELENRLKDNSVDAKNIVMIQCVGSKIPERTYCSSICCATAIKKCFNSKRKKP